jgi:hypothetical protein
MKEIAIPGYFITEDGNVFSGKTNKFLKVQVSTTGYKGIMIKGKVFKIHRLVSIAFLTNTENYRCVNHIDGNKLNNNVDNLEWCSHSHNLQHAYDTGLRSAKNLRKYADDDVSEIDRLAKLNYRNIDIAEKLSIPLSVVQKRLSEKRERHAYRHSTEERVRLKAIIKSSSLTNVKLSRELKLSSELIGRIKRNIAWKDI